ncbi:MAG: hypothetical protein ACE3L7_07375 [Candidatus Pristimantibacillus sp.]
MDKPLKVFSFYRCEVCEKEYAIDSEETEEPTCPYGGHPYFTHIVDKEVSL